MVLTVVIVFAMMRVVATASLLPHITMGTPMGIQGVAHVMVEAETLMHWDRGALPTALLCLVGIELASSRQQALSLLCRHTLK